MALLWIFAQDISLSLGLGIIIGIFINGYSVYAGSQLVQYYNFRPTYVIQAAQILDFIGLGLTYQIIIGVALGVGFEWINDAKLVFSYKIYSLYELGFHPSQTDSIRVVINFIPILIVNYLMKRTEQAKERRRLIECSPDHV